MRAQLTQPALSLVTPEVYNQLFSMHGLTMIVLVRVADPVGLQQLHVAAVDRRARHGVSRGSMRSATGPSCCRGSFSTPAHFSASHPTTAGSRYAPYSLGLYDAGLEHGLLRPRSDLPWHLDDRRGRELHWHDHATCVARGCPSAACPVFMFGTMTASFSIIFALPALTVACTFLYLERRFGMHFFASDQGGSAHPLAAPVLDVRTPVGLRGGAAGDGDDLRHHSGVLHGARWSAMGTWPAPPSRPASSGSAVWVHHMFATGMSMLAP